MVIHTVELNDDMVQLIETQRLCYAATVDRNGIPNLSPKGTVRVWDRSHIFFCDIASPGTVGNIEATGWIELNVVDVLSRRGYRFLGKGAIHRNDDVFEQVVARIAAEEGVSYSIQCVVLVAIVRVKAIWSPGYEFIPDEMEMRKLWKDRRGLLDKKFEEHLERTGPFSFSRGK